MLYIVKEWNTKYNIYQNNLCIIEEKTYKMSDKYIICLI